MRRRPARAEDAERTPRQLGNYELLEPLGSGAMGRVYRARHLLLNRLVAIKVMRPELASSEVHVERFVAEARAVNLLRHPHVIDVMDIGVGRDAHRTPWYVMELLEGEDAATLLNHRYLQLTRVLHIVRQVCEALDAIHTAGIVHRDIKPENIFITQRDGHDFVKLIDFGVARLHVPSSGPAPQGVGQLFGTPHYMSPEQVHDLAIDHRADIYAVGAVLFELISGAPPFDASNLRGLLAAVVLARPPLVSSQVELPRVVRVQIDALVARCLEKRPCDRPASARDVIVALDRIAARLSISAEFSLVCSMPAPEAPVPSARGSTLAAELVHRRRRSALRWIGTAAVAAGLCLGLPVPLAEPAPVYASSADEGALALLVRNEQPLDGPPPAEAPEAPPAPEIVLFPAPVAACACRPRSDDAWLPYCLF